MKIKLCTVCNEIKTLDKFQLNEDGSIRKHVCKLCYGRKYRAQLKLEMLEAFGWKCQCCGEDHPYFLSLDHIDGSGSEHRAGYTSSNNNQIIADAKREGWPKNKYQLLCMNCNTAKGYYGECPHKTGLKTDDVIDEFKSRIFHTGKTLQNNNLKGLKLGPLSQKIDPNVLREHRLANSKKQKSKQVLKEFLEKAGVKDVQSLLASVKK